MKDLSYLPRNTGICASSKKEKIEKRAKANTFSQPSSYIVHRMQKNFNAFLQWSTSMCFLTSHLPPDQKIPAKEPNIYAQSVCMHVCVPTKVWAHAHSWLSGKMWDYSKSCVISHLDRSVTQLPQEPQFKGEMEKE